MKGLTNDELQDIMNSGVRVVTPDTSYEKKYARYAVVFTVDHSADYECVGSNFYDLNKAFGEAYLHLSRYAEKLSQEEIYRITTPHTLTDKRGYSMALVGNCTVHAECYILADWYENKSIHDYI